MKKLYYSSAISLVLAFIFYLAELKTVCKVFIVVAGILFVIKYVYDKINNKDDDNSHPRNGSTSSSDNYAAKWYYMNQQNNSD